MDIRLLRSSGSPGSLFHLTSMGIPCRPLRINIKPSVIIPTLFNVNLCCLSWSLTFVHTALPAPTLALHNRATLTDLLTSARMPNLPATAAAPQATVKRNAPSQGGGGWGKCLVLETVQQQGTRLGGSRTAPQMPYVSCVTCSLEGKHLECVSKGSNHLAGQP